MTAPDGFQRAAALDEILDGELLGVELADGTRVCLGRRGSDVCALADTCSHAEFPLSAGALHPDGTVECVWHGARFDCRTGAVRRGPADDPVPTHPVVVRDGLVWVGPATSPSPR